ncbi:MAG TPA: DUF302 domain-containing protein [Chloroflexi bacterium]|nr:DUF302 domain-containing protein [Chloroflexota bacterium]
MTDPLAFQIALSEPYERAVEKVTEALKAEGFGILTQIDVKATLKEKLDEDFRPYTILGACNPPLAHRALENEPLVGLLLPCNVTVEARGEGSLVSIINPEAMLGMEPLAGNAVVCEVAAEARVRLERVAAALGEAVKV